MNSSQKKFYSPILYDTYGSLEGDPILVLEDIFHPPTNLELENLYFGNTKIIHLKRIHWEEFPFESESFLTSILNRLEEIILFQSKPCSILAEGYSCGLALKLVLENEQKISSIHLLTPIYIEEIEKEKWKFWNDFWSWYEKEKEAIRYFYKLPFLMDFFLKNLSLIRLVNNSSLQKRVHFWLPVNFSLENSLKLQIHFVHSEVNRIDGTSDRLDLHNLIFQKILAWKTTSNF